VSEPASTPGGTEHESKQAFVPREDRPEVKLSPDTPLGELRVRELTEILGLAFGKNPNFEVGKTPLKDFFEKPEPDVIKGIKQEKNEKREKLEKAEKNEKLEKNEKNEKNETKERIKNEKAEADTILAWGSSVGPDPMQRVVEALTGLTDRVRQLANQVEELRRKVTGHQ
jgi:hypothetical protein